MCIYVYAECNYDSDDLSPRKKELQESTGSAIAESILAISKIVNLHLGGCVLYTQILLSVRGILDILVGEVLIAACDNILTLELINGAGSI